MARIQGLARFKIHPGKLEEFKRLSANCMWLAREKDEGTLRYEIFFSEDETECIVHEEYESSEASIQHFENMGENAEKIFAIVDGTGEVLGEPSPELRRRLDAMEVRIFKPFLSLDQEDA